MYQKLFEDERITNGEYEIYDLRDDSPKIFANKYRDKGVDIFFFKDESKAIVTKRMSSLIWHGKKGDFKNLDKIKYVYAGYDDGFYTPQDFQKLIIGVYHGRRARVKPIHI